jgi:predicted nuclease with TOPRIM domain
MQEDIFLFVTILFVAGFAGLGLKLYTYFLRIHDLKEELAHTKDLLNKFRLESIALEKELFGLKVVSKELQETRQELQETTQENYLLQRSLLQSKQDIKILKMHCPDEDVAV